MNIDKKPQLHNLAEDNSDEEMLHHVFLLNDKSKTSVIEILKVGKVPDRNLQITEEMLSDFENNFNEGAYGTEIQVNLGHNRGGEAAGWVKSVFRSEDGKTLLAEVEWTPLGIEKIKNNQFKFTSSELSLSHKHHKTGEPVKNVLTGVALTNIPAVKGMKAVSLSEQANIYITNLNNMEKLKALFKELSSKDKLSEEDINAFKEAMKSFEDDKDAKDMLSKLQVKLSEEGADDEDGEDDDEEENKGGDEKKKENLSAKDGMIQLSQEDFEDLQNRANVGVELKEKLELKELCEYAQENLFLSEENQGGFVGGKDVVQRVAQFLQDIPDKKMREEFESLLSHFRTVDLSTRGILTKPERVNLSEEELMEKAEKEAQKLHEETSKPKDECLELKYKELGLV